MFINIEQVLLLNVAIPCAKWCLRCLLLVMCTHPFAKKALTLHLARSEGRERYFGRNLMHRRVLASFHQHLMAEAPIDLEFGYTAMPRGPTIKSPGDPC